MNTLSYGLLGLLINESLSGYDLTNRANIFWHTTHSRIYPLLGKLEQEGYVTFSLIRQSDKPDKKIYSLTEKGLNAVKLWLKSPTDAPVTKDEFFFKVYCMHVLDSSGIDKLLTERENMYKSRIKYCTERIEHLREFYSGKLLTTNTTGFGRYITLKKAISDAENGLRWCTWVRELYENSSEINIFEYDL
ncbi:PadR family transcriptional regulator [Clostridium paridis]|uniref:PadR family transcriptional regulator n=1 Tax=Clostridium paridis TaxID=2803863 RepID=A0A937FAL5_9CLOT|nr:PadR family transcriptional regulator [Clostridium paridis]MBL4930605.1 PadR family transcriptional regulator [Clostridium paridis]